jgi:hypothetical protein
LFSGLLSTDGNNEENRPESVDSLAKDDLGDVDIDGVGIRPDCICCKRFDELEVRKMGIDIETEELDDDDDDTDGGKTGLDIAFKGLIYTR